MGSLFSTPKAPPPDPALAESKANQKRLNAENAAEQERLVSERKRKIAGNLLGSKSLQNEDAEGFVGHRRKMMGGNNNA